MTDQPTSTDSVQLQSAWREIDSALREIVRLSQEAQSDQDFFMPLQSLLVRTLQAHGVVVWMSQQNSRLSIIYQLGEDVERFLKQDSVLVRQQSLINTFQNSEDIRCRSSHPADGSQSADTPLLLLAPVQIDGSLTAIVQVFQFSSTSSADEQAQLKFLSAVAELVSEFLRKQEFGKLKDRSLLWNEVDQLIERVHSNLDLEQTEYEIVNEARKCLGCSRVSLAVRQGNKCEIRTISGQQSVNRRSNLIRKMADVVNAVVDGGEPFWLSDLVSDPLPSQIQRPLEDYLRESQTRILGIIPLFDTDSTNQDTSNQKLVGALVVESFHIESSEQVLKQRLTLIQKQCELALKNALEFQSFPFFPVFNVFHKLGWFSHRERRTKAAAVLAAVTAVILAMVFVPADFEIEGSGRLQPRIQRHIFASLDGQVSYLAVKHSDAVQKGQVLAVLESSELDFKLARVSGDLQTTQQQLATVKISRLSLATTSRAEQKKDYNRLTA